MTSLLKKLFSFFSAPPSRNEDGQAAYDTITNLLRDHAQEWAAYREKAKNGPVILIPTSVTGFHHVVTLEAILGIALTLRGAQVHYLVCDAILPGCLRAEEGNMPTAEDFANYRSPERICDQCMKLGRQMYEPLGLPIHRYSSFANGATRAALRDKAHSIPFAEISDYGENGLSLGEHAYAGALRYFARGDIADIPGSEVVVRRYFEGALITAHVMNSILDTLKPQGAVFHHGIYVPMGIIGEVCRSRQVPVSNWNPAYRKNTFIFSHGETYHHTLMTEPLSAWENMQLREADFSDIEAYLHSRTNGTRDWIWFHEKPDENVKNWASELGINLEKPIIGLLTNVMWDAQLHYPANAFENMLDWILKTIVYFAERPELQLLIRVHPAEIRGTMPSKQPIVEEIAKAFPNLASNIIIVPPESQVSTYAATALCDTVLIYGTKTGVELTSSSIPVVVAGEAWVRNKGLTRDAQSEEDYFQLLDTLPVGSRLSAEITRKAKTYAYHFFFRRMVPLPFIVPTNKKVYGLRLSKLSELANGVFPGLDVICNGILQGTPYIYKAEKLGLHDRTIDG